MLKLTIGIINISWFRSNKNLKLDNYLTQVSIRLSSNLRLIKTVPVYVSDKICVPLTIGFIKPIIVFPIALINQLSAEQTEAILLHELAHIKRNDYLLNILLCIVQSFLFFNPAIWLMKREINKYREQCCDDLVLDNTQHQLAYARALLLIEESRNTQLILALAANGKKYTLLNRIKRIINMKTNQPSPQNKFVVLLLALIVIGLTVAWNMPLKSHILRHIKITETKSNGTTSVISAEKMDMQKHSKQNQFNLYNDKINFQPNNKSKTNFTFLGNRIAFVPGADTIIQSKNKFKIVLEDSLGNKKEYNSINELPAADQKEFLKQRKNSNIINEVGFSLKFPDSTKYTYHVNYIDSTDLRKQTKEMVSLVKKQIADYNKHFNNPEWKEQTELMLKKGEELRKQFDSPEWKSKMEKLNSESKAIREQTRKQFDTPEFRAKIEKLREESKAIADQANKQFNSPEFKQQMENLRLQGNKMSKQGEEMRQYYQSSEWKKQQQKIKKEIEKSQKEWRKNHDEQRKFAMPEKPIVPQEL